MTGGVKSLSWGQVDWILPSGVANCMEQALMLHAAVAFITGYAITD
jgi:hypothetical protein